MVSEHNLGMMASTSRDVLVALREIFGIKSVNKHRKTVIVNNLGSSVSTSRDVLLSSY